MFQSTRPHGARRAIYLLRARRGKCFNPRARMGRDCCAPKFSGTNN